MKLLAVLVLAIVGVGGALALYLVFEDPQPPQKKSKEIPSFSEDLPQSGEEEPIRPVAKLSESPQPRSMTSEASEGPPQNRPEELTAGPKGTKPSSPKTDPLDGAGRKDGDKEKGDKKDKKEASSSITASSFNADSAPPAPPSTSSGRNVSGSSSPSTTTTSSGDSATPSASSLSIGGGSFPALPPSSNPSTATAVKPSSSSGRSSSHSSSAPMNVANAGKTNANPSVGAKESAANVNNKQSLDPSHKDVAIKPKDDAESAGDKPKAEEPCLEMLKSTPEKMKTASVGAIALSSESIGIGTTGNDDKKTVWALVSSTAFDPNEMPTFVIARDCDDPSLGALSTKTLATKSVEGVAYEKSECDSKIPSGGPALRSYAMGASMTGGSTGVACQKGDALLETKEIFEVGTVTLVTPGKETEVKALLEIDPGNTPGRYKISLIGKKTTLSKSFEVHFNAAPATP